jgi:ribosomal-protein-alanine N-acetyltransferase
MTPQDLPEVLALERRAFEDPWPETAFLADLDNTALALAKVARLEGRLAGYLVAWCVAGEMHLTNLAVEPELRRMGIGHQLVDWIVGEAGRRGADRVMLEVRASNVPAIVLYRSHGFQQVGRRPHYYEVGNEDALLLERRVNREGEES